MAISLLKQIRAQGLSFLGVRPVSGLLFAVTIVAILLGGASRADVLSLLVLRPLSVILLGTALYFCLGEASRRSPWLLGLAALTAILAIIHVLPLPPAAWTALPFRDLVAATYRDLGSPLPWLPLTVTPTLGWNALFFLALPLAALLLASCSTAEDHRRLVRLIIGFCLVSGMLGLLQVIGNAGGPLYLYRITNDTAAVGLFANRNHNALFIGTALPLLATSWSARSVPSSRLRFHRILIVALAMMTIPMILLTGSRGGLLTAVIGAAGAVLIAWRGSGGRSASVQPKRRGETATLSNRVAFSVVLALAIFGLALTMAARSEAFVRLLATDPVEETRIQSLSPIWQAVKGFWPLGSGAGSFDPVFRMYEPERMLEPQYLNHAHNDWLETLMTYGLPGAILLGSALIFYLVAVGRILIRKRRKDSYEEALGLAGATILAMAGLLSVFDYPLRVPSLAVLAVIAASWMARSASTRVAS